MPRLFMFVRPAFRDGFARLIDIHGWASARKLVNDPNAEWQDWQQVGDDLRTAMEWAKHEVPTSHDRNNELVETR